jgi:ribosomal protein S18 acetylase RimI-like enzyme
VNDASPYCAAVELRRVQRGDATGLSQMFARAFDADPFFNWILPRGTRRASSGVEMFELILREADNLAGAETTADLRACAIWKPMDGRKQSLLEQVRLLPAFAKVIGWRSIPRGLRITEHMEALHRRFAPTPHVYLYLIGVEPGQQRCGLGTQLLRAGLERCDREQRRVYLETARADNVPFYERHGFKLELAATHAEFPTFWAMTREPRSK